MAGKSTYLEDKLLNWLKGTAFGAAPATVYVALFTTAPADDNTGGVEVSGGSYARAAITTSTGFSAITGGTAPHQISNAATVTFATPSGNWGVITAFGVYDSLTTGNLLYWTNITSQVINSGVIASFSTGSLIRTEDSCYIRLPLSA